MYLCSRQIKADNETRTYIRIYSQRRLYRYNVTRIDDYIKDIQNGTEDFPRFNLSEHAGLCTAGAPLIGASVIACYATASLTAGGNAEGGEGGFANWQIDECQEKLIEQWAKAANLWEDDSEQILTQEFGCFRNPKAPKSDVTHSLFHTCFFHSCNICLSQVVVLE